MRILLISLPVGQGSDEPIFPLGIGYLNAILKKEHQVKVAHYQKFEHVGLTLPDLINSYNPDLVGLTCTTFNRGNVRKIVSVIKKYCPNIKVVVGGVHASFLPEQILTGYGADFVVIGEGEYTALELCRALENGTSLDDVKGIAFKRAGSVIVTPPRPPIENLDELPMPDYDFAEHLMKISGMGFVITSRGCPVRCVFCSTSSYWGQKVRKNSVTRVVDEMEYLIDRYKVSKIFFHDDTFNLGIERVRQICSEIMRRKINIEWAASCRVTPASQEMVDIMAEAGCGHICWGVETGSETMLKNIEKKITLDQIRNAYELTKKHSRNMSSGAFAMVGNHGETGQTIRETVEFFNIIPLTDNPSTAILRLLPGTKIYSDMKNRGLVDDSIWMLTDEVPGTNEHSETTLKRWAQMVSSSGNILPFDKKRHFWNDTLFGDIPKPQVPRFLIDQSESQCKTAFNMNNTNQNSPGEKLLPHSHQHGEQGLPETGEFKRQSERCGQLSASSAVAGSLSASELDNIIPPEIKDDEFYRTILKLSREEDIRTVLEIGSSAGEGSTEAFVSGLRENKNKPTLFCIEVSKPRFSNLQRRYEADSFVKCYHASSIPLNKFLSEDEVVKFYNATKTMLTGYPIDRVLGWLRQDIEYVESSDAPNNGIQIIKTDNGISNFDMVLIDGSAFTGGAELDEVYGAKIILLDDINDIKNYNNYKRLSDDPNYTIVTQNWELRNGYAVFKRNDLVVPIHFFTIVLNGEPFIRHHIEVFKQLSFKWHWHIVEGVAELKYDTAWSVKTGGRINSEQHCNGRSNDGTTEYLDELARQYPENITVYRKSEGVFWDGKREMVNAPLANIKQECLLWQVDSDELWTTEQINKMRYLFLQHPDKTAAYFHCDYFLGPKKYVSSLNTWATYPKDWLRVWRFNTGMRWASHEPPILVDSQNQNIGDKAPFTRDETKRYDITFQHFAYVTESQVRFKEVYYGYRDAVEHWKRLQQTSGPVNPANYLPWAKNDATVDDWPGSKGILLGERLLKMQKSPRAKHVKVAGEYHASENLMKVATVSEFAKAVNSLFAYIRPRKIIETGTYLGTGTTAVIASALQSLGITDAAFYTIEVNAEHYRQAITNLARKNYNVKAINGLSVPRSILPTLEEIEDSCVKNIEFDDIFIDHKEHERALLYYKETDFENLPDDLIGDCLKRFDYRPDFVLLDSAGHMGYIEFKYLLENLKGACYIALDDTNHVKHYKSVQHIQQDPRFEIIISSKEKFGFCIARFVPAPQIVREDAKRTLWSPANSVGDIVRDSKAVKNVLIVRPDAIGDFVIFSNVLPSFKTLHPEAKISILLQDTVAQLAQDCPYIDEIITFKESRIRDAQYRSEVLAQLKSRHFDIAYHPVYSRSEIGDLLTLQSGAAKKVTFSGDCSNMPDQLKWNNDNNYDVLIPSVPGVLLETQRNREFMKGLGVDVPDSQGTCIWSSQKDEDYVVELLKGLNIDNPVVISPFARFGIKDWPIEKWAQLLSHYPDENILICAGPEDYERAQKLIALSSHRHIYNLCGKTTLSQTAVLMRHCKLYIGVDTGPAHMAIAAKIPNVVLMGGGHFGRFMPYSASTTMVHCRVSCINCNWRCRFRTKAAPCLTQISVATVTMAIIAAGRQAVSERKEPLVVTETLPYESVQYRIEEVEPARDMYQQGLRLIQSNDIANARAVLEVVVTRLSPLMTMGVQWETAGEGEHYYDTVKCYINSCTTLAQCYMQTGEFGKLKAVYQHLLENPVLGFSDEQISAFRTVIAKLQKVEPDNGMFAATLPVVSQIVESPVSRPTETTPEYLVSAIVSAYNSEKYIRGCLEDLESQTIADKLEIIVVDSGSQQNEAAIVKEFQQRYNNIKYIRTERETIYGAWNRGIKAASGKYITNANTDDRHYKDSLEKLAMALERNPRKVIAYGNQHVTSTIDGEITGEQRSKQGGHAELLSGWFWLDSQPMWRRDLHDVVGYFDEQFFCSGDYEFWIRATQQFEMIYLDKFIGKRLFNESVVSLANKHLQTLENLIIAQSYEYAIRTREPIDKQGISGDARLADWPEIKVWKRRVAAKLAGRQWQPSDEIVDVKDMRNESKPKLSVVAIETEATKWQCIQSLASQSDQDFELILIAYRNLPSQSDLAAFTGRICIVRLKDDIGTAFARNVGIANAKGDFIAYLDSSMKPNPGWAEAIFRQLTNPKMMAVRGQIIDNNETSEAVITESYATFCSSADNCVFRKSVLLEAKGFDEDMFALEGHELSCRICELANNALDVIRFEPGMLVRLDVSISESQQIIQKIRNSHMHLLLWRKHNDVVGYMEFYRSQDPSLSWQYDNDYVRIIAIAVFLQKGYPELALKWAQKAVALDPNRIKGRYLLGCFYFGMGSYDKAAAMLEPVLLTQLQSLGNPDVSNSELERQTINADCCMSTGTKLAQCYMKEGQYGKLKKVYTLLLNCSHLAMPPEQRASIQALLGKLQNVEDVPVQAAAPQIGSSARCPLKPEPCVNTADKKDEKYLVSAIVSTYNSETFIRSCLEDLENQTIADKLEIIVVNSGSEQNEESIIKEFQEKYGNIVYIKTEREGLYSAWNRAIKAASGQFLTSANTDDRHRRDAFEVMANTLLKNTNALVYGNQIITDTPNPSFENHHVIEMAKRPEFSRQRLLFGCCVGSQPMWRKSLHGEFGGFDETLTCAADWDFWLKIAQKYSFKHIDEFMGLFYRNENGIEHGRKIHSLYERYAVGKRYGNPYISVIKQYDATGNPLVSIIVTAYNAADYISRTIESILIQSYRNFEIIVVDDGSTDNTAEIVRGFKNEPIKYFFKENGGVASARNFGLQKSGGSFIIMLDSDDMMTPDYIASHLQGFEQHPEADMVYCDDLLIDEQDKPIRVINRPEYSNPDGIISDMFRCGFPVVHFKTCIKRSVFDKLGLYDERLIVAEDYDMMRRFVKQQLKMRHLPAALYLRRLRADSLSKGFNAVKAKSHFDVIRRITETFTPEQLFPDVQWDKLPAEQKTMLTKCREALAYLGIGEQYINSKAPDYAEAAFDMACEQLDECCKIEPANQQVRNLREKCRSIRDKRLSNAERNIYQQV